MSKAALVGCPRGGKSTLISAFEHRGYVVVPEMVTKVIESGVVPGTDKIAFRHEVVRQQRVHERLQDAFPRSVWRIHDRGVHDGEAYCMIEGTPVPDFLSHTPSGLYDVAFVLEPIEVEESNAVRVHFSGEDSYFCQELNAISSRVYEEHGVPVVRVPFMPVEQRMELILNVLSQIDSRRGIYRSRHLYEGMLVQSMTN